MKILERLDKSYKIFWGNVIVITLALLGYVVYEQPGSADGEASDYVSAKEYYQIAKESAEEAKRYAHDAKQSADTCHSASLTVLRKSEEILNHVHDLQDLSDDHQHRMNDLLETLEDAGLMRNPWVRQ